MTLSKTRRIRVVSNHTNHDFKIGEVLIAVDKFRNYWAVYHDEKKKSISKIDALDLEEETPALQQAFISKISCLEQRYLEYSKLESLSRGDIAEYYKQIAVSSLFALNIVEELYMVYTNN